MEIDNTLPLWYILSTISDHSVTGGVMKNTFRNISQEKQTLITQAAFQEFGQHGYQNASTNRLVKSLEISKGSLFKYFNGKLDLYNYLVDIAVDKLTMHMNMFSFTEGHSPENNILAYAEHEYNYLMKNPVEYWFFYQLSKDVSLPELAEIKLKLLKSALSLSDDLFDKAGLTNDSGLYLHLKLIISSYNSFFVENMGIGSNWNTLKDEYLRGLKKHLSYVKWR